MKKLAEYKDEEALEILADLVDPVVSILGDPKVGMVYRTGNKLDLMKAIIKNYPKEIIDVMAILDGVPREEYHINIVSLPKMLLEIIKDPLLSDFFVSQGEMVLETPSGSATETTQENEI